MTGCECPLNRQLVHDTGRPVVASRGRRSDSIEWPLHNAHQASRHEGLLRIVVPPFSASAWMTLTGPLRPVDVAMEFSGKHLLTRLPPPGDPTPPLGNQPTYRSRTTHSERPMAAGPTRPPRLNTTLDKKAGIDGACRAREGAPAQCLQAHAVLFFEVIEA